MRSCTIIQGRTKRWRQLHSAPCRTSEIRISQITDKSVEYKDAHQKPPFLSVNDKFAQSQRATLEAMHKVVVPMFAVTIACLMSGCSSIPTRQVDASSIINRNKAEQSSQFIGFAGDRAFKFVRLIPLFGRSPREFIWWCPVAELTPSETSSLRAKTGGSKGP